VTPDGDGEGIVEFNQYWIERLSTSEGFPRVKKGFGGNAIPKKKIGLKFRFWLRCYYRKQAVQVVG